MKNLYNTIEKNLKAGLCVVIKDVNDNTYCSILNHKDEGGNYRMSFWYSLIELSKQYIGEYCGESKDYWDNIDLEIVEVYRPEYEPFKVGQKVRILDSIKKIDNWEDIKRYFPDMTGEIRNVYISTSGTYYSVNGWIIGHEYLAPLEEEQEDNVALEAIKLLEEKGYKIVRK